MPLRARLIGEGALIAVLAFEILLLQTAGVVPTATTSLRGFFLFLLLFIAAALVAIYCALRACQIATGRLAKYDHRQATRAGYP